MSIQQSIKINCTVQEIFAVYKDVNSWAQWDPDIEAVHMDGEFIQGTTGWIKPRGAPKTNTCIIKIAEPYSFTVETKLPFCSMLFTHDLQPSDNQTIATHAVHFNGFLAPLFTRIIGRKISQGINDTMRGLKTYAENQH